MIFRKLWLQILSKLKPKKAMELHYKTQIKEVDPFKMKPDERVRFMFERYLNFKVPDEIYINPSIANITDMIHSVSADVANIDERAVVLGGITDKDEMYKELDKRFSIMAVFIHIRNNGFYEIAPAQMYIGYSLDNLFKVSEGYNTYFTDKNISYLTEEEINLLEEGGCFRPPYQIMWYGMIVDKSVFHPCLLPCTVNGNATYGLNLFNPAEHTHVMKDCLTVWHNPNTFRRWVTPTYSKESVNEVPWKCKSSFEAILRRIHSQYEATHIAFVGGYTYGHLARIIKDSDTFTDNDFACVTCLGVMPIVPVQGNNG